MHYAHTPCPKISVPLLQTHLQLFSLGFMDFNKISYIVHRKISYILTILTVTRIMTYILYRVCSV